MNLKLPIACLLCVVGCPAEDIRTQLNSSHQLSIEVRVNGSDPIPCNLHSGGGDRIYLDRGLASKLRIAATGSGPGEVSVEVGKVKLSGIQALIQDRPAESSCMLGQTVFRQYIVEVNYETPVLRLHDRAGFRYAGPGKPVPLNMDAGNPMVNATITTPNHKAFAARIAVDTGGGPALVMLSKRFVDKNKLLDQWLSILPEARFGMEGGQPKVVSAQVEKVSVGGHDIPNATIHLWRTAGSGVGNDADGLLCGGFLRRFKLFFDYEKKSLILEPASAAR
jgi:hypothetical protein